MTYERRIDRLNPALIVLLVDQSESMVEAMGGGQVSKSQVVADQLNRLVYELVIRCVKTPREEPRPYFSIAVVGYSTSPDGMPLVRSHLPGTDPTQIEPVTTTDLARNPLRVEQLVVPSGGGTVSHPIWLEPTAQGGTPMCAAFDRAGRIAVDWTRRYPHSFPPIVINLTDGEATDGQPLPWAKRIRALSTSDGNALLFNIDLSATDAAPTLFPATPERLPDAYAATLYQMSSPLPQGMVESARTQGIEIANGARGFAYNADITTLALFLNVGTSIGRAAR